MRERWQRLFRVLSANGRLLGDIISENRRCDPLWSMIDEKVYRNTHKDMVPPEAHLRKRIMYPDAINTGAFTTTSR
jgi:hypothetical protein